MHARALAAVILAFLTLPASAAADRFTQKPERCAGDRQWQCATLAVPLDRARPAAGTARLAVVRLHKPGRREAVLALSGGPGQAAISSAGDFADSTAPLRRDKDLLVYDQRGTGQSSPLIRCRELEPEDGFTAANARRCARKLGPTAAHFATSDSVADIESLRRRLGYRKLTLFAVSYGTKVALDYARTYPQRVRALVLDSPVDPDGRDPFNRESLLAPSRVAEQACSLGSCRNISASVAQDLRAIAPWFRRRGGFVGRYVDTRGRWRRERISAGDFAFLAVATGYDSDTFDAWPAAVAQARRGDTLPLVRLWQKVRDSDGTNDQPRELNITLYAATSCADHRWPWRSADPAAVRRRKLAAFVRRQGGAFGVFGGGAARELSNGPFCTAWPWSPRPRRSLALPRQVPTLLLVGQDDAVTPLGTAAALAGKMPQAQLLSVPNTTHDVLSSEPDDCAERGVAAFAAGQRVAPCPVPGAEDAVIELDAHLLRPRDPETLAEVTAPERQRTAAGRVGAATLQTLAWLSEASDDGSMLVRERPDGVRVGGLRGGYAVLDGRRTRLKGVRYVRDLAVSGNANYRADGTWQSARLRLRGPGLQGSATVTRSGSVFVVNGERFVLGGVPEDRDEPEPVKAGAALVP